MSIQVQERAAARELGGTSAKREYYITGAGGEQDARLALLAYAPSSLPSGVLSLERVDNDCTVEEMPWDGLFMGTANYKTSESQPTKPNTFTISVEVAGQSSRLTQAYKHIGEYAPSGKTARKFKGAIGVTSDGAIEGAEVIVPAISYVVNLTVPSSQVDDDYVRGVATIVGSQNKKAFHGYKAGELLLTRVSGSQRGDGNTDLSFSFSVSLNETSLVITGNDGDITIPNKRGWDYLWVFYDDRTITDGSLKYTARVPISAHLEQVYKDGDFAKYLGI